MEVLFDGPVWVHYRFLALEAPESPFTVRGLLGESFGGQANGLCGAQVPYALQMHTGLHTGEVPVRVERYDERPGVADEWEDVVEVSVTILDAEYAVTAFEDWYGLGPLEPGDYRARWCASGMDAGADADCAGPGEAPDRYLLQLWPQAPEPDVVVRQGSAQAAYWAVVAAETPPPDLDELRAQGWGVEVNDEDDETWDPAEQEVVERAELLREAMWADRPPSATLREWGDETIGLAMLDRDLLDELTELSPEVLRALAVHAARTLAERAGGAELPVVRAALDVVAHGGTLAGVWQDWETARAIFAVDESDDEDDEMFVRMGEIIAGEDLPHVPTAVDVAAVEAIRGAADPHDGRAAVHGVFGLLSSADDLAVAAKEVRATIARLQAAAE